MKDQSDEKQQNKYNCKEFEDINGLDLSIRKVIKMDESVEKASNSIQINLVINFQCNSFRVNEQQKSVIQQIKHLARQGSHMYVTINILQFLTATIVVFYNTLIFIFLPFILFLVQDIQNFQHNKQINIKTEVIKTHQLMKYGKQYEYLSHLIKTKTAQEIIQFYYFWKFTSHYKLLKINKAYYHRSNLNNYV